ncbi:MAG: ABC-F family ATP-binding cassette domain-containing protein [Bacteroidota bacterium]
MISIQDLTLHFGDRPLYDEVSFLIQKDDRIGLTGKNGAGKSTLLKILAGLQKQDTGIISMPREMVIGYLPQEMDHNEESTIAEEAGKAFAEINRLNGELEQVNTEISTREDYESDGYMKLLDRIHDIHERLNFLGGDQASESVEKTLLGLGFEREDLGRKMKEFSGGWKMRVELAKILLQRPGLMLLDEPTNHLDIESILWLEEFLINYPGAIVLISHDKRFLDSVTKRTIEISNGNIYDYKAPYTKYLELRKTEIEIQKAAQKNQQKYIEKTEILIDKYRAKANKASFAQSLIKKLDKIERIEVDEFDTTRIHIKFPPAPHSGKVVLEVSELKKSYPGVDVLKGIDLIISKGEKIALLGKNGAGKSTFTRLITGKESYEGQIKLGHSVVQAYFAQNEAEKLDRNKTVFETVDHEAKGEIRTQLRGLLGAFLFRDDDIEKKVSVLSGGEKTRLALCKLMLSPANFIILDEPTNHLDLASKEVLKSALKKYDGTLLLVSHDRDFLSGITDRIYELRSGKVSIHHMDIDEFLKMRKNRSIAEFEQKVAVQRQSKPKSEEKPVVHVQEKEKKKNEQRIQKLEKDIASEEEKLKKMEAEMAGLDYSDAEKAAGVLKQYDQQKEKIESLYMEWESLQK